MRSTDDAVPERAPRGFQPRGQSAGFGGMAGRPRAAGGSGPAPRLSSLSRQTVLLLDKDHRFRDGIYKLMRGYQFDLSLCDSRPALLRAMDGDGFDAVMIDQPVYGPELLRDLPTLRDGFPGPIMILTHVNEPFDSVLALEAGADAYIEKSENPREIVARLRALIRRSPRPSRPPS